MNHFNTYQHHWIIFNPLGTRACKRQYYWLVTPSDWSKLMFCVRLTYSNSFLLANDNIVAWSTSFQLALSPLDSNISFWWLLTLLEEMHSNNTMNGKFFIHFETSPFYASVLVRHHFCPKNHGFYRKKQKKHSFAGMESVLVQCHMSTSHKGHY